MAKLSVTGEWIVNIVKSGQPYSVECREHALTQCDMIEILFEGAYRSNSEIMTLRGVAQFDPHWDDALAVCLRRDWSRASYLVKYGKAQLTEALLIKMVEHSQEQWVTQFLPKYPDPNFGNRKLIQTWLQAAKPNLTDRPRLNNDNYKTLAVLLRHMNPGPFYDEINSAILRFDDRRFSDHVAYDMKQLLPKSTKNQIIGLSAEPTVLPLTRQLKDAKRENEQLRAVIVKLERLVDIAE